MTTAITTQNPVGTYEVEAAHTVVGFAAKHLGIATVRGRFHAFEGGLVLTEDLADARAWGSVEVASVDTGEPQRDDHLRSDDFFDAVNHPRMEFVSTRIEQRDSETYEITGELTIRGVTREVVLTAEVTGTTVGSEGEERLGLEVRGAVSRKAYGMKFDVVVGSNALVGDKVRIELDVAAVRKD